MQDVKLMVYGLPKEKSQYWKCRNQAKIFLEGEKPMIHSVLAQHVEQGVKDFLRTTFPVATPLFADTIEQLSNEPGNLFVSVK